MTEPIENYEEAVQFMRIYLTGLLVDKSKSFWLVESDISGWDFKFDCRNVMTDIMVSTGSFDLAEKDNVLKKLAETADLIIDNYEKRRKF